LFVLLLSVALHVSGPLPEPMESVKESHEGMRVPHARQFPRSVRDAIVAPVAQPPHTAAVRLATSLRWEPPGRPMTTRWVRKTPLPVSDSRPASEDH